MLFVGTWVVLLGTGLIIVAAVVLAMRWHSLWLIRRLRTTPRRTCSELTTAGRPPRRVLLSGTTAPGPAGLLVSPGNRVRCVWYRFAVSEPNEGVVSHDPHSLDAPTLVRRSERGPIGLDDGTGTVLLDVDIALNHVSGKGIVIRLLHDAGLSRRHPAEAGSPMANLEAAGLLPRRAYGQVLRKQVQLQEEIIEGGVPVTVLGRPRRTGGRIVLGHDVLSAADPDSWVATQEADARSSAALLPFFWIGVVVCAVGVVLIPVGLY